MDELLEHFLIEGRDLMAAATAALASLAHDPEDAAAIDAAFRAIHTLKGSVAIFPMAAAERTLHAAEDVLERARKEGAAIDAKAGAALVACLDAVDRWIDELETTGALSDEATTLAAKLIGDLPGHARPGSSAVAGQTPEWARQLAAYANGPATAFRYTPDADCFFRGDDPLAVAAAIPDLLWLHVRPAAEAWPSLDALDPFRCISILEGVSAAPIEALQGAFRLMRDQVELHPVAPEAKTAQAREAGATSIIRVDAVRVDALADGVAELLVAVHALAPLSREAEQFDPQLASKLRATQGAVERAAAELRRGVHSIRLVPLAPVFRRFPRMVREIAAGLGKSVTFATKGETLEVDKQIAEGLYEPLLHLLRNAIDHGIEAAAQRSAAGKAPEGGITLAAAREGDAVLIELVDDGAGIDPARIREVAVIRGVLEPEAAERLGDAEALRLIFAPGFSTAGQVTELSGRGVGMDAVRAAVEKLRGTITVDSTPGQGTHFRLRFPAHALTTQLLLVEAAGERYGVPFEQVVETVRLDEAALMPVGEGTACVLRGQTVPVLSLARLLDGREVRTSVARLLVTRASGETVALRVDGFGDRMEAVLRAPSGLLAGVRGISGTTLLGDGSVLLVLDLGELAA